MVGISILAVFVMLWTGENGPFLLQLEGLKVSAAWNNSVKKIFDVLFTGVDIG